MINLGSTSIQYAYLIAEEATAGSAETCDKDVGIVTDITNSLTREEVISRGISSIEPFSNNVGMTDSNHKVTLEYQHGRMFEFILGPAAHANSGSDYKHTFTISGAPATFTAQRGSNLSSDVGQQSTYNVIEDASLSIDLNGILTLSYTAKGKAPTAISTVPAHTVSTLAVFPHALCSVSINGSSPATITKFSIDFKKKIVTQDGIGSNDHNSLHPTELSISFSGTLSFDADTYYNNGISNDITTLDFVADNGVAYGSGQRGIELDLTDIQTTGFNEIVRIGDLVTIELSGIATVGTAFSVDNIAGVSWL